MQNKAAFDAATTHAGRSDVLRYEILARHGGVYVDTDIQPLRGFDALLSPGGCFIGWQDTGRVKAWTYGEVDRLLCPSVIGSEPGHPAMQALLDALPEWVKRHPDTTPDLQTGPVFVTKTWEGRSDVRRLPCHTFYPVQAGRTPHPRARYPGRQTYAVHHWAASWQK
jgi:mannosyltransferase OCH1-like enzyme